MERHARDQKSASMVKVKRLFDLAESIKDECEDAKNNGYFNFFDVPDVILRKNYNTLEYQRTIKYLNKVRVLYLEHKLDAEKEARRMEEQ